MRTLLIVYHSMTGGTLQMAQAAACGARAETEVQVSLLRAADARPERCLDMPAVHLCDAGESGRRCQGR